MSINEPNGHPLRPRKPVLAAVIVVCAFAIGAPAASARTWHVSAAGTASGTGSVQAPFASLAAVQAAAGPGDTIVVDPAPLGTPPLNGGIALKPAQRLLGGGAAVLGRGAHTTLPVLTNTDGSRLSGDAVRLANGTKVSNLVIRRTARGGIYGLDSVGVEVTGNDVSEHNTSCTKGFLVQPFTVPTGVPFVGGGVAGMGTIAPQNGWAGIMVDGDHASGSIRIRGNVVHDADCGDGIDIRAAGSSDLTAHVDDNTVTRLKQGQFEGAQTGSVLAIGMQARDSARLHVDQIGDTETYIGSDSADCEGQFANTSESGAILETVDRNTFAHGIGGTSCNGFETIVSSGGGAIDVSLSNSTFEDDPGDMFEEGNLGTGSTMRFVMNHVVARHTTIRGGTGPASSDPGAAVIPFNIGDCMSMGNDGAIDTTVLRLRDTVFEDCNSGIDALSGTAATNGVGPAQGLILDIDHSRIAGHAHYGLQVLNVSPLRLLQVKVQHSEITGSGGFGAALDQYPTGTTQQAQLDLGGGTLGSEGANCLFANRKADVEATAYSVDAQHNWWGHPGGPATGQTATGTTGRVITDAGLAARPDCGPRAAASASPTITIASPRDGARFAQGARILARYRCAPAPGQPGPVSCQGTVRTGTRIDTQRPGRHPFAVRARDSAGRTATRTVHFTVLARHASRTRHRRATHPRFTG